MTEPDLSIVIINWNTREMLRDCLETVFTSLGDFPAEVIVVDNASEDGSADMVSEDFPRVRLIRNERNMGFAAANNQGFEIANGRHVLLLNSDTLVHGDVLAQSVKWLDAHPEAAAMGCRVLNTDGSVQRTCSMYPSLLNQFLLTSGLWKLSWPTIFGRGQMANWGRDDEREVEVISGCYLLVRRSVIAEIGDLDEDFFFFGEETDWCRRMSDAGWKLVFAPVGEITHHGSVSAWKLNYRRDLLLTTAKVLLHKKHNGTVSALLVWFNAVLFNGSRAVLWTVKGIFDARARPRAQHFRQVVAHLGQAWSKADP